MRVNPNRSMTFFLQSLVRKCSLELITVNFNTGGVVQGKYCMVRWCYDSAQPPGQHRKFIGNKTMEEFLVNEKCADVLD